MNDRTVLFVSPDASRTGAPILLLGFLKWFQRNRRIPFRVLLRVGGPLVSAFEELAPVDIFEPKALPPWRLAQRLGWNVKVDYSRHHAMVRQRLSSAKIGLIYSNTIVNGRMLNYLRFLDCPVLCHVHELDRVVRDAGPENLACVKSTSLAYIAVSDAVRRNLVEMCGVPPEAVHLVYGFVDGEVGIGRARAQLKREVLSELGCAQGLHLVCGCGSIEPRKGTDLFLEVAAQVVAKIPNRVQFVWVGGRRGEVKKMQSEMRARGLDLAVRFTGRLPDVTRFYAASDVFLLPSREDPFPLVMLEAALQGTPIICFRGGGGAAELVRDDAGIVVPDISAGQMADSLIALLNADESRSRMGQVARARVLSRHNIDDTAKKIAGLIDAFLEGSGPSAVDDIQYSSSK